MSNEKYLALKLLTAIDCMAQDNMMYGYGDKDAYTTVLKELGIPLKVYEKIKMSTNPIYF